MIYIRSCPSFFEPTDILRLICLFSDAINPDNLRNCFTKRQVGGRRIAVKSYSFVESFELVEIQLKIAMIVMIF